MVYGVFLWQWADFHITGLLTEEINGTTVAIYVSEYQMPRIRRIDIEAQTVVIVLDFTEQGEDFYSFQDILKYGENTFLLLSRYGLVEANVQTGQAQYILGSSE